MHLALFPLKRWDTDAALRCRTENDMIWFDAMKLRHYSAANDVREAAAVHPKRLWNLLTSFYTSDLHCLSPPSPNPVSPVAPATAAA